MHGKSGPTVNATTALQPSTRQATSGTAYANAHSTHVMWTVSKQAEQAYYVSLTQGAVVLV